MKLSSSNMSVDDLIAAFNISRSWQMETLNHHYASVLTRRLSAASLPAVSLGLIDAALKSKIC